MSVPGEKPWSLALALDGSETAAVAVLCCWPLVVGSFVLVWIVVSTVESQIGSTVVGDDVNASYCV